MTQYEIGDLVIGRDGQVALIVNDHRFDPTKDWEFYAFFFKMNCILGCMPHYFHSVISKAESQ